MNKAILISIKPKWVAKILNREKTIEIRKTMPKCDLPIDVYIYCTKDLKSGKQALTWLNEKALKQVKNITYEGKEVLGKVVAKFTLNKVEEIVDYGSCYLINKDYPHTNEVARQSCLNFIDLKNYLKGKNGYAWHIDNLVIFDEPKELSEFYKGFKNKYYKRVFGTDTYIDQYGVMVQPTKYGYEETHKLTKAPQSWCYVEVEK